MDERKHSHRSRQRKSGAQAQGAHRAPAADAGDLDKAIGHQGDHGSVAGDRRAWRTEGGEPDVEALLPAPEVILLLGPDGRIVRASGRHMGTRLSELEFIPGRTLHDVMHSGCADERCQLVVLWSRAWRKHYDGLPVEWEVVSHVAGGVFKLRLQSVSYACAVLYRERLESYQEHSVLFIQDISTVYGRRSGDLDRVEIGAVLAERLCPVSESPNRFPCKGGVAVTVSRDAERRRIAAELHDGLGQILSLLRFEIEGFLERAEETGASKDTGALERIHDYALESLSELRRITRNLRPAALDEQGLIGTLETLCSELRAACPDLIVRATLSAPPHHLPDDLVLAIYRIAQEALNNIATHAEASEAQLTFSMVEGGCELLVMDDGVGLPAAGGTRHGFGLDSIRQRAEGTGGEFRIRSLPGKGCELRASWGIEAIRLLR